MFFAQSVLSQNSNNVALLILSQLRGIDRLEKASQTAETLLELVTASPISFQREAVALLPEMVADALPAVSLTTVMESSLQPNNQDDDNNADAAAAAAAEANNDENNNNQAHGAGSLKRVRSALAPPLSDNGRANGKRRRAMAVSFAPQPQRTPNSPGVPGAPDPNPNPRERSMGTFKNSSETPNSPGVPGAPDSETPNSEVAAAASAGGGESACHKVLKKRKRSTVSIADLKCPDCEKEFTTRSDLNRQAVQ